MYSKVNKVSGSNRIWWNVSNKAGIPVGQIWTFQAVNETHPHHVKLLNNDYAACNSYKDAVAYIEAQF